jgi:hypothetical protein
MAEIKHTFQAGRMNKDLDERIVPNGEYRDALNIEVTTSDGSDVGSAQNIYSNYELDSYSLLDPMITTTNWNGDKSGFVGSVSDEKTNKSYFLISAPDVDYTFRFRDKKLVRSEDLNISTSRGLFVGNHDDVIVIGSTVGCDCDCDGDGNKGDTSIECSGDWVHLGCDECCSRACGEFDNAKVGDEFTSVDGSKYRVTSISINPYESNRIIKEKIYGSDRSNSEQYSTCNCLCDDGYESTLLFKNKPNTDSDCNTNCNHWCKHPQNNPVTLAKGQIVNTGNRDSFVPGIEIIFQDYKNIPQEQFLSDPRPPEEPLFVEPSSFESKFWKDMVVSYDSITKKVKPVLTDIFHIQFSVLDFQQGKDKESILDQSSALIPYESLVISSEAAKHIRPGMTIRILAQNGNAVMRSYYTSDTTSANTFVGYPINSGSETHSDHNMGNDHNVRIREVNGNTIYFDREVVGNLGNAYITHRC